MKRAIMNEIKEWLIGLFGVMLAAALFGAVFWAFVMLARDAFDAADAERLEAVIGVQAAVPRETEAGEAADYEIYREGDGPAPAWYRPDEAMAAEWSADKDYLLTANSQLSFGEVSDYILDVPLDAEFQTYLHGLCEENGVPYTLAVAVIEAESTYRAEAVSNDGDYGLMQINWRCLSWLSDELGIVDFLDPYQNAKAGVWILGGYYLRYGYASGALVAYNQGQQSAETMFSAGIYETDYSRRVMEIQRRLEAEGR